MVTAFIMTQATWRWAFWLYSILNVIALSMIVLFLDEPYFNRTIDPAQLPRQPVRWKSLVGISQWETRRYRASSLSAILRPFAVLTRIPLLGIFAWGFVNFAWVTGVSTTSAIWLTSIYRFDSIELGLFYFAAVAGVGLGAVAGHWSHDATAAAWSRRHGGHITPEMRLILSYPSTALIAASLLVLGFALERVWHYMVVAVCPHLEELPRSHHSRHLQVFFGTQLIGFVIAVTAVSAYIVDTYPECPFEAGMWFFFVKCTGGFFATYVQVKLHH